MGKSTRDSDMKENLSEEEMRLALLGAASHEAEPKTDDRQITSDQQHVSKARRASMSRSPKLRVWAF